MRFASSDDRIAHLIFGVLPAFGSRRGAPRRQQMDLTTTPALKEQGQG